MAPKKGSDDEEVVASGEALRLVAGWLGVEDAVAALTFEEQPANEPARPQGLGLGAKYLPHHKGVMLAAGVEHRLGNKLKQSRDRQQRGDGGGAGQARPSSYRDLLSHRGPPPPPAGGRAPAKDDSDEDGEEDRGRGASFQAGKRGAAAAGLSRSALLASESPAPGKHRKRNKKKHGSAANGQPA